jgi:NhaP-type Na+/H+ or K+/H+ antiporter
VGINEWFLLVGCLMLARGLAATTISRSPLTSAIVYLGIGLLFGPSALNVFNFDPTTQSAMFEVLTEIALLISLFSAGIKMPVPFKFRRWDAPLRLAWLSMTMTVGLVALFGYYVLDLPAGAACCWVGSWRRPIRCWPPTCRYATPATRTSCASR